LAKAQTTITVCGRLEIGDRFRTYSDLWFMVKEKLPDRKYLVEAEKDGWKYNVPPYSITAPKCFQVSQPYPAMGGSDLDDDLLREIKDRVETFKLI
jgi:hypothetical protein